MNVDYVFNVCLVGSSGVGKTSLANRLQNNQFPFNHNVTIGVEFYSFVKKVEFNNSIYCLRWNIYDTAGQEKYASLINSYYKLGTIVLLGFDLTDEKSFNELESWLETIKNKSNNFIKIHLFGNKIDLDFKKQVFSSEIENFIDKHKLKYFEISVKSNINIDKIIDNINIDILTYIYDNTISKSEKMKHKIKFLKNNDNKIILKKDNFRYSYCC